MNIDRLKIYIKFILIRLKLIQPIILKPYLNKIFYTLNKYYISSEKGIFYKTHKYLVKIVSLPSFGIAVNDNKLYFSSTDYLYTYIFELCLINKKITKTLFKKKIDNFGNRIHELFYYQHKIYFAATYEDKIGIIDLENNKIEFLDLRIAGQPHLHLNSLFVIKDIILFTLASYNENNNVKSAVGIFNNGKVYLKKFPNKGIHNILFDGSNIYFNDTFGGDNLPTLFKNNKKLIEFSIIKSYFTSINDVNFAIRGISIRKNEMLLGSSNKGPRSKRFNKNGYLIRVLNGEILNILKTPFSQVYDIILSDGNKIDQRHSIDTHNFIKFFERMNFE